MITIRWQGKAVSVNRWHVIRGKRIYASKEYEGFINGLSMQIRAEGGTRQLRGISSLLICACLWKMRDKQNLLKPICDALERSGLIKNDRDIEHIHMLPAEEHKRDELDEIHLFITEVK